MASKSEVKKSHKVFCIPINEEGREEIEGYLDEMQGRAYADVLRVEDIFEIADEAEQELARAGIARSYRTGATYWVSPDGPTANAYRYARTGTSIVILRKRHYWALIKVTRERVWPRQKGRYVLTMTDVQRQRSFKRFLAEAHFSPSDILKTMGSTCTTCSTREVPTTSRPV